MIDKEGLDISPRECVFLIDNILSMFQGLDLKAKGWLARVLVITYDYFTYKYDPDLGPKESEIVTLLAAKTNITEANVVEAIQTLKALRLVPDDILPDMRTGDKYNL